MPSEREQFGRLLKEHEPIANHLAIMKRQVDLSQYLVERAARQEELEDPLAFVWASLAKLIASETAIWAAGDAMLLHGGTGYVNEMPISRIFRDSAVLRIYEGAAHIQVKIVERYPGPREDHGPLPAVSGVDARPTMIWRRCRG